MVGDSCSIVVVTHCLLSVAENDTAPTRCRRASVGVERQRKATESRKEEPAVSCSKPVQCFTCGSIHFCTLFRCGRPRWRTRKHGSSLHTSACWSFSSSVDTTYSLKICQENKAVVLQILCLFKVHGKSSLKIMSFLIYAKGKLILFFFIMVHWVIQYSTVHWVPVWSLKLSAENMHHCLAWFLACQLFVYGHSGSQTFRWEVPLVAPSSCLGLSLRLPDEPQASFRMALVWGYFQNHNFLNFPLRHQSPILHPQFMWQFLILWFCFEFN